MRPAGELTGVTRRVLVPGPDGPARVHVVLNWSADGRPKELFLYNLPSGSRALGNALARLVSLALQRGVEVQEVAGMLKGQHEGYAPVPWPGGGFVLSVPDAAGRLLEDADGR